MQTSTFSLLLEWHLEMYYNYREEQIPCMSEMLRYSLSYVEYPASKGLSVLIFWDNTSVLDDKKHIIVKI